MSTNVREKHTKRVLKLRNKPTILKERNNGYHKPKLLTFQTLVESRKEQRSRWLAGDPKEFIERIKKTKKDISQEGILKGIINSLITIT